MTNRSSAELRLSLNDLIANTIYEFLDNEDVSPEEDRENRLTTEDAAESILGIIGLTVNDGPNEKGEIEATFTKAVPDEFSI
jgi:hypothetical protein